jgi:hypothetical protein
MKFRQLAVLEFDYSSGFYQRLQQFSNRQPMIRAPAPSTTLRLPEAGEIDCLVASWKDHLTAEALEGLPRLAAIFLRGTNTSKIDHEYVINRGIHLSTISGYGDRGTSEFVIQEFFRSRIGTPRTELAGKRVGLIGLGGVGLLVAKACSGLGMEVFYHVPNRGKIRPSFARYLALDELLETCEFISFHSPAYEKVVSPEQLRLISDEAVIVITTLGVPVDVRELIRWKRRSKATIAMDLCAAGENAQMLSESGVTVRQLYAARTIESIERAESMLLENMSAFLAGASESRSIPR